MVMPPAMGPAATGGPAAMEGAAAIEVPVAMWVSVATAARLAMVPVPVAVLVAVVPVVVVPVVTAVAVHPGAAATAVAVSNVGGRAGRHRVEEHRAGGSNEPRHNGERARRAGDLIQTFDELRRRGRRGEKLSAKRPAPACHAPERRDYGACRDTAGGHERVHRRGGPQRHAQPRVHRSSELQEAAGALDRVDVAGQRRLRDDPRELELPQPLVGLAKLLKLVPGRRDEIVRVGTHGAHAEPGGSTHARIEIEVVQPGRLRIGGRPHAIHRRRDDRIGRGRRRENGAERRGELRLHACGPRRRAVLRGHEARLRGLSARLGKAGMPKPGALSSMGARPTSRGALGARSRRASEAKSPAAPVVKVQ